MSSRKEEERNEKIIRGLMKLPPNRRCINCNSLGPQYVCTTFWTFVCMTCSGIHREFTHRVKSVSMSKFTSQEVEALQNGGNQRAREIYLKGWDPRQRLPDNSNVEKVRQFIKNVYVDKRYAVPKSSDKPPRDLQNSSSHEEDTRRASSYHSYSQSPPYDFQYEERRYGKHAPSLTRKPGSDKGLYEGKFSSFLSPSWLSDHTYEDRFGSEGSNPRISDYSVSSGGDQFRSDAQSPNFQREIGSAYSETSRNVSVEDLRHYTGRDGVKALHPQRTTSLGSFGSFDSMSFKSISSVGVVEVASEFEQSLATHCKEISTSPSFTHPSASGASDGLDLFSAPSAPQHVTSVASVSNNSQIPRSTSAPPLDLFQPSPSSAAPTFNAHQVTQNSATSSLDLFSEMPQQLPAATVNVKSPDIAIPQNDGWATFDTQNAEPVVDNANSVIPCFDGNSAENFNPLASLPWSSFEDPAAHNVKSSLPGVGHEGPENVQSNLNAINSQWPSSTDFSAPGDSSSTPTVWNETQEIAEVSSNMMGTQSWDAFEDSYGQPNNLSTHTSDGHVTTKHPSVSNGHLEFGVSEDFIGGVTQTTAVGTGTLNSAISSHDSVPLDDFSMPEMAGVHTYATDNRPTNPFDLPYDSDTESNNMPQFWDMSSLQATLPNGEMPTSFAGDATEPWYTPASVAPYVPSGPQGALGFMAAQAPSVPIPNVHPQGPVASIGGNPFA